MKVSEALVELYELRQSIKHMEARAKQLQDALKERNLPTSIQTDDGEVSVKLVEYRAAVIPEYWRAGFTAIRMQLRPAQRRRLRPGYLRK